MFRQYAFDVWLMITCAFSIIRGGPPERLVAILLAVADLASVAVVSAQPVRFHHDERGLLFVDSALFAALYWIAIRSTRWWPLFVAAFQLDTVGVHVMRILAPATLPLTYFNTTTLWAYPILVTLFAGTWRHRQRVVLLGADPPWKAAE